MLTNVLQADELEELKTERRRLRVRLTATNGNAAASLSVDQRHRQLLAACSHQRLSH